MHSSSQQSCKVKIISYRQEEPRLRKTHILHTQQLFAKLDQSHSLIKASRQRLKIGPSLPGDWTSLTGVWGLNRSGLKHTQGHGIGLIKCSLVALLLAVAAGIKCVLGLAS